MAARESSSSHVGRGESLSGLKCPWTAWVDQVWRYWLMRVAVLLGCSPREFPHKYVHVVVSSVGIGAGAGAGRGQRGGTTCRSRSAASALDSSRGRADPYPAWDAASLPRSSLPRHRDEGRRVHTLLVVLLVGGRRHRGVVSGRSTLEGRVGHAVVRGALLALARRGGECGVKDETVQGRIAAVNEGTNQVQVK